MSDSHAHDHRHEPPRGHVLLRARGRRLTRQRAVIWDALTVESESWEEFKDGSAKINQVIFVRKDSQKAIVLGHGGQRIKAVREAAQAELEAMLGRPVHLFLYVKVRENWQDDRERYRDLGLDFDA